MFPLRGGPGAPEGAPLSPTLDRLPVGARALVTAVSGDDALSLRLQEMGLLPDTEVLVLRRAPFGDPLEVELLGYRLLLREAEARQVSVRDLR